MIAASSPREPILVVGAGPAGATAARALAAAGVRVRLLDRAAFPRNKPCGGGISMRALRRFPYLELALPRIATHTVARLHLEGPGGESTLIESDGPAALLVRRVEFDALLVSLALEAGAELVSGADIVQAAEDAHGVTLTARDGRRFQAPIVIAADGVHSVIARRLGLNRGWPTSSVALDMMEETPRAELRDLDPSTLWVAYGYEPSIEDCGMRSADSSESPIRNPQSSIRNSQARQGYAYIFPKRDHVNVGIGYVLSHYREAIDQSPYELQRGFVSRLRDRGIVSGESNRSHFTPFLIPVGGPLRQPGRGRVLLTGDAGGFVNGVTAEGIYYAMVSGDLAARAVLERAPVSTLARRYRRACDYEIGAELRDSVLLQRFLFADRRRIARIIGGAHRERQVTQWILDFAVGRQSYRTLRRRLLARSPMLLGRLWWERLAKRKALPAAGATVTI
ncbi:MAG: FAD-dependent monooxygenase [Acidobacteria bacterium]|nr:FAD-dependent monooxygenase [Acidobacteriota bacterium]